VPRDCFYEARTCSSSTKMHRFGLRAGMPGRRDQADTSRAENAVAECGIRENLQKLRSKSAPRRLRWEGKPDKLNTLIKSRRGIERTRPRATFTFAVCEPYAAKVDTGKQRDQALLAKPVLPVAGNTHSRTAAELFHAQAGLATGGGSSPHRRSFRFAIPRRAYLSGDW